MPKAIPELLLADYASETHTFAYLWRLTRRDGVVLRLTDFDQDIVFDGQVYVPGGYTPTANRSTAELDVDNMEAAGPYLDHIDITEEDMGLGRWDGAFVEIMRVNHRAPDHGCEVLRVGWIGEVTHGKRQWRAELRGLAQKLQTVHGRIIQPDCQADLGDAKCQVDLTAWTVTGEITSTVPGRRDLFRDATRTEAAKHFDQGYLLWLSGANEGARVAVKAFAADGTFELQETANFALQVGDTYSVHKGCMKTRDACKAFGNVINFQGFPDLPGRDAMQSPEIEAAT